MTSKDRSKWDSGTLLPAVEVAAKLKLPLSVLSFLEAQLGEVRAVATGARVSYRREDAALLAGIAELIYGRGVALRDAKWALGGGEADAIREIGRVRLELAPANPEARAPQIAARPIPPDAVVGRAGEAPECSPQHAPAANVVLLNELVTCVRLLEEARR